MNMILQKELSAVLEAITSNTKIEFRTVLEWFYFADTNFQLPRITRQLPPGNFKE
jgi:hypothetical protein